MTIILDAGHGPHTPGKRSPDGVLREFHFNQKVAQFTKKLLVSQGMEVLFSHDETIDVPLKNRTLFANKVNAQLFVSIHANAFGTQWNDTQGIETYIYPSAPLKTKSLGILIHESLLQATNRKNRGLKTADFAVLRETKMPAVLVECGFMTNREEANLLLHKEYQIQCAHAIAFGIMNWLYRR